MAPGLNQKSHYHWEEKRKAPSRTHQNNPWLLNMSVTALAAAGVLLLGHWFSKQGRCSGGRGLPKEDEANNSTLGALRRPKNLAELRLQRLKAVEARSHHRVNEPSATRLTPLGMILSLTEKVDKLEEEVSSFLVSIDQEAIRSDEEKEHARLLDLLVEMQLEIDAVRVDETARGLRRTQTSRIQGLIEKLDKVKLG